MAPTFRIDSITTAAATSTTTTAMFYFLVLNSGSVFAGNDIFVYPVTSIGFVFCV